jgi:hypothetical protein
VCHVQSCGRAPPHQRLPAIRGQTERAYQNSDTRNTSNETPQSLENAPSPGRGQNAVASATSTRGDGVEYATTTRRPLPCPPTKSVCNDFADTPGGASSSAVLAAAATARWSPSRMHGVPCDGVCVGTIVDAAGFKATDDHKRAWSGDTRQSNATRRARLEKRVEIDFYRRILDTVGNVNARIGAGRAGSCKDWPRSVDWGMRPSELALLYGHGGLLVPRRGRTKRIAREALSVWATCLVLRRQRGASTPTLNPQKPAYLFS